MRKPITVVVLALVLEIALTSTAIAAAPIAGKPCSKSNTTSIYKLKVFTCIKSGKKLVWSKPVAVAPIKTTPTPTPVKGITVYTGGAGGQPLKDEISFELPVSVENAPVGTNVKLWIYSPSDKKVKAESPGIYYRKNGGNEKFLSANSDGSFYAIFAEGSYQIDVRVTSEMQFFGRNYSALVNSAGVFSIPKLLPNSAGFFTVTVDDRKFGVRNSFVPTTKCQLLDQTNVSRLQVGFPKAEGRLPSFGVIRAIIIPVDFPDVVGRGQPSQEFAGMMDGMNKFFVKMSGNKVKFDFQVLADWVRMPVKSTFHNLGTWGKGDLDGYQDTAVETADPLVDYSKFDVVYVLSPKEIPSASIAYGPASPWDESDMPTNDGPIRNFAMSGADAWHDISGGSPWRWASHETGHLFGLHDLYVYRGDPVYGDWDVMSGGGSGAIELNSWNRYLLGWLADSQMNCLVASEITTVGSEILINPIERPNDLSKAIVVKLSDSKILVIESRRNEGFDKLSTSNEGTLVYTVDMTIPSVVGGWKVQRRPGSTHKDFVDAALRQGDVITVNGIRIEVLLRSENGDLVKVSKP